jgi:hypothetical protein
MYVLTSLFEVTPASIIIIFEVDTVTLINIKQFCFESFDSLFLTLFGVLFELVKTNERREFIFGFHVSFDYC